MKCSYCGNELENSAEFCPQCGMILGIDNSKEGKEKDSQEEVFRVPEYIPNVFTPVEQETEEEETAQQLEADPEEEIVPVTENIPEYVSSVPEGEPLELPEENEEEIAEEAEKVYEEETEETSEETDEAEEAEEAEEADEAEETDEAEEAETESAEEVAVQTQAEPEETQEDEETSAAPEQSETLQVEEVDEPVYEDFKEETNKEDGVLLGITVPDEDITYPEYEDYNAKNKEESITPEEEQYEDITDYVPEKKKKSAKGFTVVLLIAIICVVVGGLYMTDNLPVISNTPTTETTQADTTETSEEDTTEEDTTEEDTTEEDTTEEDTTEEDTTEEDTTEELTEETTTVPSTAQTTTETTTSATTTTRPQTTTASQTTTAAATTKPQTTTSATTERYGINDVEVKKPSSFYSKSKTLYCTAEGVILRSGPATSYDRVLYLSKGADLTVLADEDGFYYVKSNRYGVYGWVSASYVSSSRSETEETKVYSGTVKPDKYYENAEVKYATDGLNMRKGPGTDYSVITVIIKNYPLKVIGYSSENSGWVYVTDTTYGISGWVNSAYLK